MGFLPCIHTPKTETEKARTNCYKTVFGTFGPLPKSYLEGPNNVIFTDQFLLLAQTHFPNLNARPYAVVIELTDKGYVHGHYMLDFAKESSLWWSFTYRVKDLLALHPDPDPDQTRLITCRSFVCRGRKRDDNATIMANYLEFSNKGKNIGEGVVKRDPLGPKPIRPTLDKLPWDSARAASSNYLVSFSRSSDEWGKYHLALSSWNDRNYKLDTVKRYRKEHSWVLSEPTHPHHAYHKSELLRKQTWLDNYITRLV